ncbi:MAG: hypothetical protein IKQ83_04285 [Lachnospiraceae bacterium]|nr:hypothetical protein [Lachnospiraceae bacterium]
MTAEKWCELNIFEQMSNIAGEIKRYIDSRNSFARGETAKDYSGFYFDKAINLIDMTAKDPKNSRRLAEFEDDKEELRQLKEGEVSDEYIMDYWNQYTMALTM